MSKYIDTRAAQVATMAYASLRGHMSAERIAEVAREILRSPIVTEHRTEVELLIALADESVSRTGER